MSSPEASLLADVARVVGVLGAVSPLEGHAQQAELWRVEPKNGAVVVLKQHRAQAPYRRELWGFQVLAPALGDRAPRLVGSLDTHAALLIEHIDGVAADDPSLTEQERDEVHRQAGELRACLDAVSYDDTDPVSIVAALDLRARSGLTRARPHLDDATAARIDRVLQAELFGPLRRVPCHRDFAPWNWIVERTSAGPRLRIIDFGQARPDVWHVDLVKLWAEIWPARPRRREAFLRGLGRPLQGDDVRRLDQLSLLHALGTLSWGAERRVTNVEARGRQMVEDALARLA